ncbi:hypothetical protein PLICRDRAFT_39708 [Plicaturopsis crispa FD-325 SS-3]|nr:hypothetical protein PLICRDRAFT_39708 [Plicaturopsis crispa FD-325 SS-3]
MPLSETDLTLGALEIGALLATCLYGVTTVQVYIYARGSVQDRLWVRSLVAGVWLLETLHTLCIWIYIYRLSVTSFGIPSAYMSLHWTLNVGALFNGIVGALVQAYFAKRILMLSGDWVIPIISWTGSLFQLCLSIVTVAFAESDTTILEFHHKHSWIIAATCATNVAVDILNTSAICYILRKEHKSLDFSSAQTNEVVDKLILWSIETGMLTAVAATLTLILCLASPETFVWIGISFFYAKLYSNSLLVSLNGRAALRKHTRVAASSSNGLMAGGGDPRSISIHVHTETEVELTAPRLTHANSLDSSKGLPFNHSNILDISRSNTKEEPFHKEGF